jgi:hypothetical protein
MCFGRRSKQHSWHGKNTNLVVWLLFIVLEHITSTFRNRLTLIGQHSQAKHSLPGRSPSNLSCHQAGLWILWLHILRPDSWVLCLCVGWGEGVWRLCLFKSYHAYLQHTVQASISHSCYAFGSAHYLYHGSASQILLLILPSVHHTVHLSSLY